MSPHMLVDALEISDYCNFSLLSVSISRSVGESLEASLKQVSSRYGQASSQVSSPSYKSRVDSQVCTFCSCGSDGVAKC
jgi:hypothetical protein